MQAIMTYCQSPQSDNHFLVMQGWLHCILYVLFENGMGLVKLWAVIAGETCCILCDPAAVDMVSLLALAMATLALAMLPSWESNFNCSEGRTSRFKPDLAWIAAVRFAFLGCFRAPSTKCSPQHFAKHCALQRRRPGLEKCPGVGCHHQAWIF